MADSDKRLVERTLDGDRDAFAQLLERYAALVHGIILERVRRSDEVEDLVQETFTRAYQGLGALRQPRRFAPWIGRTAANVALDWVQRRQQRLRVHQTADAPLRLAPSPDELYERGEQSRLLWRALDGLTPDLRRLVVLHHIEGCSHAEIARFLDMPRPTVKWRLSRARDRLQREITRLYGTDLALRSGDLQRFRERAMGAIPAVVFLRPPRPGGWAIAGRVAAGLAGLAGAVGLGMAVHDRVQSLPAAEVAAAVADLPLRVRYEPRELPDVSVVTRPARPRTGQVVQVEVSGEAAAAGDAYLHYRTGWDDYVDRVVPLEPAGETHVARVPVPAGATAILFHLSTEPEPVDFVIGPEPGTPRLGDYLRRYDRAFPLHGDEGRPVRGSMAALGSWARMQQLPPATILAYLDREVALYPDNLEANRTRLNALAYWSGGDPAAADARARRARERALTRFPDDPDAAWALRDRSDRAFYARFLERFPDDAHADDAAFGALPRGDWTARVAALEAFLAAYADSPYGPDAMRERLYGLGRVDTVRANALADSLIDTGTVPPYDARQEAGKQVHPAISDDFGLYPLSYAYIYRTEAFLAGGDTAAALGLAQALRARALDDPIPYVRVAELLRPAGARDLRIQLLEHAEPLLHLQHMSTLPGYMVDPDLPVPVRQERLLRFTQWRVMEWRLQLLAAFGALYVDGDRPADAVPLLTEAADKQDIRWDEPRPGVYLDLARAHERLGRCGEAAAALERLLDLAFHHPVAERQLRRLHEAGCGADGRTYEARRVARWRAAPELCGPVVHPAAYGDTLCVSHLAGAPLVIHFDTYAPVAHRPHLRRLQALHERFSPQGVNLLQVVLPGVYRPPDGGPPQASTERFAEVLRDSSAAYPVIAGPDGLWRTSQFDLRAAMRAYVLYVVDARGRLRLRQGRAWGVGLDAQDGEVVALLEALLAEPVAAGAVAARESETGPW